MTLTNRLKIIEDLDASIFMRLTKAEEINAEITEAGSYSESIDESIDESINEVLLKIEDVIQENKPKPQQIPNVNVSTAEGTGVSPEPSITVGSNSKLPKLVLKSYSGNPAEFMPIWDSFSAAINKNSSLMDIDKMTHLKTLCVDEAALCISGFYISAANYKSAVKWLIFRFGDTRIIINHHMDSLVNLQPVKFENDIQSLCFLYDKIMPHIRALQALNIEPNNYSQLLVSILTKKIPHVFMVEISKSMNKKTWDLDNVLQVLKDELESHQRVGLTVGK